MDIQDQFSLTFSNESAIYANNTIYSFRTIVNPPIYLPHKKWEVALSKMLIPKTRQIYAPSSDIEIQIQFDTGFRIKFLSVRLHLPVKMFTTFDSLVKSMEERITDRLVAIFINHPNLFDVSQGRLPGVQFSFGYINNRINFGEAKILSFPVEYIQFSILTVRNGLELWRLLGFQGMELNVDNPLPLQAKSVPTFSIEASTLFVLAPNLIADQFVGENKKPLLELIPYNLNSPTDYNIFEQTYPIYKQLIGGYINNVQIELADVDFKPVYFDSNKLQIVLHFRPSQHQIVL